MQMKRAERKVITLFPCIQKVPESERLLIGSKKRVYLSTLAREVLKTSAEKSGFQLSTLQKRKNGAPIPANGIHWSITHKSTYVGAVAAPFPLGIDIEMIRPVNERLLQRIAMEKEWYCMGHKTEKNFFRLWTAKEAVLKAEGVGLTGLSKCSLIKEISKNRLLMNYSRSTYIVIHHFFDDHIAALTLNEHSCEWSQLSS